MKKLFLVSIFTVFSSFVFANEFNWCDYEKLCWKHDKEPSYEDYEYLCENPQCIEIEEYDVCNLIEK